jgi:S-adenosyl-L-methionine hydrolase (adenosine-forming)
MSNPPIITLLTDFSSQDGYVGAMKGVILSLNPQARIFDLTHEILPQDVLGGALALATAVPYFPTGTIHVAVVDPGVGSERKPILVVWRGHYLIGPDNGLLSLAFEGTDPESVYYLTRRQYFRDRISRTFHGRDIFAPAAGHLSLGIAPEELGETLLTWEHLHLPVPQEGKSYLRGEVIHVDRFGNLITNIREEDILRSFPDKTILTTVDDKRLRGIKTSYTEAGENELLAIIGSGGRLEISQNRGHAAQMLNVGRGAPVTLEGE